MDIWECLGIERTADIRTIQRAYGRMAVKYHPEEHPEEFKKVREAYETALRFAREQGRMERREQLFNREIHSEKPADPPLQFSSEKGTDIPDKNIHPEGSADQPLQFSSEEGRGIPDKNIHPEGSADRSLQFSSENGTGIPDATMDPKEPADQPLQFPSKKGMGIPDRDMHSKDSADESLHFPSEEGRDIPDKNMHSENSTDESLRFPSEEGRGIPDRDMFPKNPADSPLQFPSEEKTGMPDESMHREKNAAREEDQQGYRRLEEESDEDSMGGIQYPEIPREIDVRKRRDPVAIAMGYVNDAFSGGRYSFVRQSALKNFVESDIFLEVRYKPEFQRRLCNYIREHPYLNYTKRDRMLLYRAFDFQIMEAVLRQIPYPELKLWLKSGVGLETKEADIFAAKIYVFFRAIFIFFLWFFGIFFIFSLICYFLTAFLLAD